MCVCVCGRGGGFKIRVSNNPYVTFVGTTNRPMAPQSISIKDSMYRSLYTTWCGKLEYTDGISISKQLSPRIPQTLDPNQIFNKIMEIYMYPYPLEYNISVMLSHQHT